MEYAQLSAVAVLDSPCGPADDARERRRYAVGVHPTSRKNTVAKCRGSTNPLARATSGIAISPRAR